MLKFSVSSAFRRKFVSLLAILGVGLGSGLLVALLSLSQGIQQRFNQTFQQVSGTISVTAEGGNILGRMLGTTGDPLPASYEKELEKIAGVELVSSFVSASVRSERFGPLAAIGIGITGIIDGEELFGNPNQKITEGRSFQGNREVIVGARINAANRVSNVDLKVGDSLTVPAGKKGETVEIKLVGVYETGDQINDYGLVGSPQLVRRLGEISKNRVSGFMVRVVDPTAVSGVAASIEKHFEGRDPAISASVAGQLFETLNSFFDVFNLFLLAIALVAAAAGGTAVMVVMLLTVSERRREFGILKAAGWSGRNIVVSVLITSLTLSILGVALGLTFGMGAAFGLQAVLGLDTFITFTLKTFAWATGVGMVTGIIGGILPAISAVRVSPIETLRGE